MINLSDLIYEAANKNSEFEDGYAAALATILKGKIDGIDIMQGLGGNGDGDNNGLDVPFKIPPMPGGGSGSEGNDNSDNNQEPETNSSVSSELTELNNNVQKDPKLSDKVKDKIKKATQAALAAASKDPSGEVSDELSKQVHDALDDLEREQNANKAAENSGKPADSGKENGSNDSSSDKTTDQSGNTGEQSSENSSGNDQGSSSAGNSEDKGVLKRLKNTTGKTSPKSSSRGSSSNERPPRTREIGPAPDLSLLERIAERKSKEFVEKAKNTIVGTLGDFNKICKAAMKVEEGSFLAQAASNNAAKAWNKVLETECRSYLNRNLQKARSTKFKRTYRRVNRRRAQVVTNDALKNGNVLLVKGKEPEYDKISFQVSLFIDMSGSMGDGKGSCLYNAQVAAFSVVEKLIDSWCKTNKVDPKDISKKYFLFNTSMHPHTWGDILMQSAGSTYDFSDLLCDIQKQGKDSWLNIIISDGGFSGCTNLQAASTISKMPGLFAVVVNSNPELFDEVCDYVKAQVGHSQLICIGASDNFDVDSL